MAQITSVRTDFYKVPLETVLSDSTHRTIPRFELVTVRVRDADGAKGMGYTYAVNSGAAAFHGLIESYVAPTVQGQDADHTESLWQQMW